MGVRMGEKRRTNAADTVTAPPDDGRGLYLAEFSRAEKELAKVGPPSLQHARKAAIARFGEVGFPTAHDEEWRFTNVAPLARIAFKAAMASTSLLPTDLPDNAIVFVNGHFARAFPAPALPGGVIVGRLADVLQQQPQLVEPYLTRLVRTDASPFTALNTAFLRDGAFVYVPRGVAVQAAIHFVFLTDGKADSAVAHLRNLIVVGENAQVTLVESYLGSGAGTYFTNVVSEISVAPAAVIDHYKVQQESQSAYHIATMQVHQAKGSRFSSHALTFGGALARNDANVVLDAENCECTLNGLYMGSGTQVIDNHTRIDHAKPNCASHELYKGILGGQARGVFNGKIYVHPDAQKTDAKQTNKTLLLSDDAVIDTKPQLEIYADDVKCTHGATIGQLDAEQIFYLRSRGVGLAEARSLLTYAFANDIVGRVKVDSVRTSLERVLLTQQGLPVEGALA
jgi:Fe-S cluster assembly protein SufD